MRKSITTLIALFAWIVAGCTSTTKKKRSPSKEQLTTESLGTSSENLSTSIVSKTTTAQSSIQTTSSTQISSGPIISNSAISIVPPPTPGTEVTKTIVTAFDEFKEKSGFNAGGQQIDTDLLQPTNDKTKNAAKLKSYFESVCDGDGMVSDIVFHNLNTNESNTKDLYLTAGTASAAGSITWTSTTQMKSVSLTVKNYYKYYKDDYTNPSATEVCHTDSAQLSVNNEKYPMIVTDISVEPTHQTFTYAPSETFTSLSITNDLIGGTTSNRIFIESITITFVY